VRIPRGTGMAPAVWSKCRSRIADFNRHGSFSTHPVENAVEISTKKLAPEKYRTLAEIARISAS